MGPAKALAWARDGRTLAVSHAERFVAIWDTVSGRRNVIECARGRPTKALALSPDARLLAVGWDDDVIRLYEVATAGEVRRFRGHPPAVPIGARHDTIQALAFAPDGRTLASGGGPCSTDYVISGQIPFGNPAAAVRLWDVMTGKPLRMLPGHQLAVHTLAFAPDGTTLFSGGEDDTVLCWEVADVTRRPTPTEDLPAGRLAALRDDLASRDAARGQQAVADFLRSPDTVPFLKRMLLPGAVPARRLADLIADLDHDEFARRQRASQELERIGEQAAAALRRSLEARPSLEARRRMSLLLEALDEEPPSPRAVRMIRALQVLEGIGTPEARRVIEDLSCGDPKAHRTREAKASLERLARRPPS